MLSLASWPLMLALMPAGQWILRVSGHAPAVLAEELDYFNILMLGSVASPLGAAISGYFTGRGDTLTNMYANLAGNLANVALDYAMIFGRWGCPEMGIAGAAWATVISGFIGPAIMLALYFGRTANEACATRANFRFRPALMARMIRFGLPSAAHLLLDVGSFSIFVLWTGRMGEIALSASNIALAINNIAFMPLIGMSIGASILVGQYQGRRDSETAEKAGWTALKIGWAYMFVIALTFVFMPRVYFGLFAGRGPGTIPLEAVLPVGRFLLLMMATWGMMDTVNLVISGALKGAGDTRFVMYYSVAMMWVVWLTGEAVILLVLDLGIEWAWVWLAVYVFLMAVGFLVRFRSGRWKSIELLDRQTPIQPNRPGAEALAVMD